jgi:hypothetical protein
MGQIRDELDIHDASLLTTVVEKRATFACTPTLERPPVQVCAGIWACGGGQQNIAPVLVGVTFQAPQSEPEFAWWCYIGPRPEFENETDSYKQSLSKRILLRQTQKIDDSMRQLNWNEVVKDGDMILSTKTQVYGRAVNTIGMTVAEVFELGKSVHGETVIIYRSMKGSDNV